MLKKPVKKSTTTGTTKKTITTTKTSVVSKQGGQTKSTPAKEKVVKGKYVNGEVTSFLDIPDKFETSYEYENCPLTSWDGYLPNTKSKVKSLKTTNALFTNFKGVMPSSIETLSLVGSPVSRYPLYRVMAILAFGPNLSELDGTKITKQERDEALSYDTKDEKIAKQIRQGFILRSKNDKLSVKAAAPSTSVPVKSVIPTAAFSEFFDGESIREAEKTEAASIATDVMITNKVQLQEACSSLRVLFSGLDSSIKLVPFFEQLRDIAMRIPQGLARMESVYKALDAAISVMDVGFADLCCLVAQTRGEYYTSVRSLSTSCVAEYCSEFISACEKCGEMLNIDVKDLNFDSLSDFVCSIDKLITTERVSPFDKVLENLRDSVEAKRDALPDDVFAEFMRKVKVAISLPMRTSFEPIMKILQTNAASFSSEIEICCEVMHSFSIVTEMLSTPKTIDHLVSEVEKLRDGMISQLNNYWTKEIRPGLSGSIVMFAAPERIYRSNMAERIQCSEELQNWLNNSRNHLTENEVYEKAFAEVSTHCTGYMRMEAVDGRKEVEDRIAVLRKELESKDAEIAKLKAQLAKK